jgi:hypothetical protein
MATTTPNYGWPVPTSTDYVKDGATAIEALGDAIDATVFGLPSASGLTLISATTIGTAVSSVTVTGAFSATYDNYKISVIGGANSTQSGLTLQLGATTSGYYAGRFRVVYVGASTSAQSDNNASNWSGVGMAYPQTINANIELQDPFATKNTIVSNFLVETETNTRAAWNAGFLNNTTSYTDFTLAVGAGTMTGGIIRVYGYQNS